MKKGDSRKKTGFTIIEVALVLAIAGLIFLMVFIALPSLQRSQRDSRRRDDILSFLEAVKKYQTNNRGDLPDTLLDWSSVAEKYMGSSFIDPDGSRYELVPNTCHRTDDDKVGVVCTSDYPSLDFVDHRLYIYRKATCDGTKAVGSSNPRNIAVLYRLEGAGIYCANT